MTFFVPYDGSELAQIALQRATDLADEQDIVVCTVVPSSPQYARENGWIGADETFDQDDIEDRFAQEVHNICPGAEFRCLHMESHVTSGSIVTRLRDEAQDIDATVVFLGSENVGSIAAPVASIGSNVATRVPYDIYLVQSDEAHRQ